MSDFITLITAFAEWTTICQNRKRILSTHPSVCVLKEISWKPTKVYQPEQEVVHLEPHRLVLRAGTYTFLMGMNRDYFIAMIGDYYPDRSW